MNAATIGLLPEIVMKLLLEHSTRHEVQVLLLSILQEWVLVYDVLKIKVFIYLGVSRSHG